MFDDTAWDWIDDPDLATEVKTLAIKNGWKL